MVQMAKRLCDNVKCWTGGRTKFNRTNQVLPKSHSVDAACIGESGSGINLLVSPAILILKTKEDKVLYVNKRTSV